MQVLHGQASVLQQTTANLTGSSTDVEYCIVAGELNQDISELFSLADQSLFWSQQKNSHHAFHRLLPAKSTQPYNLRPRGHSFSITQKQSSYDDC